MAWLAVQVMVTVGALLAYCVGWPYAAERASYIHIGSLEVSWWRIMLGLGLVPAVVQVLTSYMSRCIYAYVLFQWMNVLLQHIVSTFGKVNGSRKANVLVETSRMIRQMTF